MVWVSEILIISWQFHIKKIHKAYTELCQKQTKNIEWVIVLWVQTNKRGQRKMTRLVQADRKVILTHNKTHYENIITLWWFKGSEHALNFVPWTGKATIVEGHIGFHSYQPRTVSNRYSLNKTEQLQNPVLYRQECNQIVFCCCSSSNSEFGDLDLFICFFDFFQLFSLI